jgi:hypothetical protein
MSCARRWRGDAGARLVFSEQVLHGVEVGRGLEGDLVFTSVSMNARSIVNASPSPECRSPPCTCPLCALVLFRRQRHELCLLALRRRFVARHDVAVVVVFSIVAAAARSWMVVDAGCPSRRRRRGRKVLSTSLPAILGRRGSRRWAVSRCWGRTRSCDLQGTPSPWIGGLLDDRYRSRRNTRANRFDLWMDGWIVGRRKRTIELTAARANNTSTAADREERTVGPGPV